jgi:GAF domain-containing protein
VIGTIELVSRNTNSFTRDNLRILESIAAQAAIAVQNAQEVIARESKLKQEIYELKIEIDQNKKTRDVTEITKSEYFQELQNKVKGMKGRKRKTQTEESGE